MTHPVDVLLSLVLLSILLAFGSSRLPVLVKMLAFQGIVVSVVPLFTNQQLATGTIVFTLATMIIRGMAIPYCIHHAIAKVGIRREIEAVIGYHASVLAGLLLIVGAVLVSRKFSLVTTTPSALLLPATIVLLGAGMFLLMARRNAFAMVLGYMMMENGIYLAGTTFSMRTYHIIEFGILLDVLAGVMIMAVILQHIKQTFDDVDTALLRTLKE